MPEQAGIVQAGIVQAGIVQEVGQQIVPSYKSVISCGYQKPGGIDSRGRHSAGRSDCHFPCVSLVCTS
jgi:hypothetical protein